MDSSNAEMAWEAYLAHGWVGTQSQFIIAKDGFMAGRASRDAEVATLREQLAAAEAVIEKAKAAVPISAVTTYDILCAAPSSALAAHDREVAAHALEGFAETWAERDGIEVLMFAHDDVSAVQLIEKAILARAAALRSGTEGSTS